MKTKKQRPRSLRQSINDCLRYRNDKRFADFIEGFQESQVRVCIELHGTADVTGVIVWAGIDAFVVDQGRRGVKLLRIESVIGISKGEKAV